ncbi:hypothetical protein FOA52_015013 [Chlamydomonas sp. UWO 241]|nr:hypothetical protein FOA52_015013 [Chlamydomonas sp. UWO 241]
MASPARALLLLLILGCAALSTGVSADSEVAEITAVEVDKQREFDYFVFVRQWLGSVCDTHACPMVHVHGYKFTIHGLWPQFDDGTWPQFCDDTQFDESLLDDIIDELEELWPSYADSDVPFWEHEWSRHGTCAMSVMPNEHAYFKAVLDENHKYDLAVALSAANIVPSDTKYYPVADVLAAVKDMYGATPLVHCDARSKHLKEIWMCIGRDLVAMECPHEVLRCSEVMIPTLHVKAVEADSPCHIVAVSLCAAAIAAALVTVMLLVAAARALLRARASREAAAGYQARFGGPPPPDALDALLGIAREAGDLATGVLQLCAVARSGGGSSSSGRGGGRAGPGGADTLALGRASARLLVAASGAEKSALGSTAVYAALLAEEQAAQHEAAQQQQQRQRQQQHGQQQQPTAQHQPLSVRLARARHLLARARQEGYHPAAGGAAHSVVLGREDKLAELERLRSRERALLHAVRNALHALADSPTVEMSQEELQGDALMAAVVAAQAGTGASGARSEVDAPTAAGLTAAAHACGEDTSLRLDLDAVRQLLAAHPDSSIREQVYAIGLHPRCCAVLQGLEQLAAVRRHVALLHDLPCYADLAHASSLVGGPHEAVALLAQLADELRPTAETDGTRDGGSLESSVSAADVAPSCAAPRGGSSGSSSGSSSSGVSSSSSGIEWSSCYPSDLPLELLEAPSQLLELLGRQPAVVARLLPGDIGDRAPRAAALARRLRALSRCPLQYLIQVLTMLLDQLLLCRGAADGGGDARPALPDLGGASPDQHALELWLALWRRFGPLGLPPTFSTQQASSLLRVANGRGTVYGYAAALSFVCQAWEGSGMARAVGQEEWDDARGSSDDGGAGAGTADGADGGVGSGKGGRSDSSAGARNTVGGDAVDSSAAPRLGDKAHSNAARADAASASPRLRAAGRRLRGLLLGSSPAEGAARVAGRWTRGGEAQPPCQKVDRGGGTGTCPDVDAGAGEGEGAVASTGAGAWECASWGEPSAATPDVRAVCRQLRRER